MSQKMPHKCLKNDSCRSVMKSDILKCLFAFPLILSVSKEGNGTSQWKIIFKHLIRNKMKFTRNLVVILNIFMYVLIYVIIMKSLISIQKVTF